MDSLYISSLNNRIDLLLSSGYKYIELNSQTERIKSNFNLTMYKFENEKKLFKIAYKNKKELNVYRLSHKIISKDTIDVNISKILMKVKKGIFIKRIYYSVNCGGANGYQPDFRYVFSENDRKWIAIINYLK